MNSRLLNCLKILRIIRQEANLRGITKVLLNGDIFEDTTFIETDVYDAVYMELEAMHNDGLDTVINVGNHDVSAQLPDRLLHALRPFRRVAQVVDKPKMVWGSLAVIPWMEDTEKLKETISRWTNAAYGLVLHVGVHGARTGPNAYIPKNRLHMEDLPTKLPVLLSDYHTQQFLTPNIFYLGSPLQHTGGETHKPCIWDVVLTGHGKRLSKIYTNLPVFRTVTISSIEDAKKQFNLYSGDYIRCAVGKNVSTEAVAEVAAKAGCLIRIERTRRKGIIVEVPKTLKIAKAVKRYAAGSERLTKLGLRLTL